MQRSSDSLTRTLRAPNSAGMRVRQAQARRLLPRLVLMACLAALAVSQAFLPSAQAGAGPCRVPSNAYPTIQAAVNDATCATINVAAGTYTEHVTIARDVTIRGAGQDSTVIDGGGSGTVLTVASGTVTLRSVTIQHGARATESSGRHGGGIWNAGSLTVENSTVADNEAFFGGGIWNEGTLTVRNSTFSGNSAFSSGGGIDNRGTVIVENSTVAGNRANNNGGGIYNSGTLTVEDSTVADNSAFFGGGGGIFNFDGGTVTLTDVTFQTNIPDDCTGCPGLL